MRKYWQPQSVTWWTSMTSIALGMFVAFEPVHGLASWAEAASNMTGGQSPYMLITTGLIGVGLRGAMK